jgi:hypothetical protein
MAKIRPDSRMPRRLPHISSRMKATDSSTRQGRSTSIAEASAAVPADTLTATVST